MFKTDLQHKILGVLLYHCKSVSEKEKKVDGVRYVLHSVNMCWLTLTNKNMIMEWLQNFVESMLEICLFEQVG